MVPGPVLARRPVPRTIALVGIDGSGKTTQAHLLADALAARGLPARYRRNAGGRHWFGKLAVVLGRAGAPGAPGASDLPRASGLSGASGSPRPSSLSGASGLPGTSRRPDAAEALLGRRGMLFVESVLRWLAILRTLLRRAVTREVTVMDRYAVCQFASIRARGGRSERWARLAYRVFPRPDVTFLLAVDPAVAYERIERRGYDHEEMSYLRAADAAYRALPEFPTFVVIDANGTPEQVQAALLDQLPAPFPSRSFVSVLVAHARAVLVAAASLAAAATVVTYQWADGF